VKLGLEVGDALPEAGLDFVDPLMDAPEQRSADAIPDAHPGAK
jgi:hypothetical protein